MRHNSSPSFSHKVWWLVVVAAVVLYSAASSAPLPPFSPDTTREAPLSFISLTRTLLSS